MHFILLAMLWLASPLVHAAAAPKLSSSSPADDATGISLTPDLLLTFDHNMAAVASKYVYLYKSSDDSLIESVLATNTSITNNIVTVDFTSTLAEGVSYYVNIDSGAFIDTDDNNDYAGISRSTDLNFTTLDNTSPTISLDPANGATNVANNVHAELEANEFLFLTGDDIHRSNFDENRLKSLITFKKDNASGEDIPFSVMVDTHTYSTIEIFPNSNLASYQVVYVAITPTAGGETLADAAGNAINATSATFTAGANPYYTSTYPTIFQKNIGIDANIVLDFDRVMNVVASNEADTPSARTIKIWDTSTSPATVATYIDSNGNTVQHNYNSTDNTVVTGSGTTQITINPAANLEERVDYYITIDNNALKDAGGIYFPGISDNDSLTFKTAKDPNKYADVTTSNETHVEHSMHQAERSINAITNRQNYIRRNGGRNISHQGINFKFNNQRLDQTLNQLSPLIQHFEQYNVNKKLSKAVDNALPDEWGLWTAGEIVIGETNADNGSLDRRQDSREISVGLDKSFDKYKLAGIAYRFNKTETRIGSTGTKMDSNTQSWSLYGSIKNGANKELEALVGWSDISTDHTRVDGVNTYTGVRDSHQVFGCFIARENHNIDKLSLSPFVRLDTSYTKQYAYSETGDSDTAYDALHYKDNNFHDTVLSLGLDVSTEYQLSQKTLKPYLSFRHKENMGYESSNTMYYLSNPIKEYTQTITSNHDESGFNLITGVDVQSEEGWLINLSYELSESELTLNKGLRFRVDWKF